MDTLDLDLPSLPRLRSEPSLPPFPPSRAAGRKRPFISTTKVDEEDLAAAFNTSSDPAVFSSEETPDLDNYSGSKRRKKKVYSGTWWSRLRSREKLNAKSADHEKDGAPRQFRRNFDSGIFMGDESGSSSGMESSSDPPDDFHLPPALSRHSTYSIGPEHTDNTKPRFTSSRLRSSKPSFRRAPSKIVVEMSPSDIQVEKVIQQCLDTGAEDVDLTDLHLKSLPTTVTELNTLVRQNSEFTYSALSSRLRLYLGNNSFTSLPLPLLDLRRTILLSLRQNQLKAIPPAIRKLRKLAELNISGNAIEYLPFEIIDLFDKGALQYFAHDPNPWLPTPTVGNQLQSIPILQISSTFHLLTRVAVSPATTFGPTGNIIPTPSKPSNPLPHLSELILRSLRRTTDSASAISSLYADALPPTVHSLLFKLAEVQTGDANGQQCTFCTAELVLPRYKWLEWWSVRGVSGEENFWGNLGQGDSNENAGGRRKRYRVLDAPRKVEDGGEGEQGEVVDGEGGVSGGGMEGRKRHHDPVLPFLRVACGCVSQTRGLDDEAARYREC